jgi:hypothetical protein
VAGRRMNSKLPSFSWKRAAEMSAAKQRLSGRTEVPPARSKERRSVWRVLGWSIVLAVLAAATLCAIAFKLGWLDITEFYHGPAFRSAGAIPRSCIGIMKGAAVESLKRYPRE